MCRGETVNDNEPECLKVLTWKGPAGCDLVEDTIGSGLLRLFRKWPILPERFVSTSKAKSEGEKTHPWHLRLYSYCINWTHYTIIFFLFGFWGFFSCFFWFFFLNVCLSFKIGLWGLLLYLSRLWGQMHEFQLPHQECIKHWMRMGGTNQIMWAELEFILICYIPSPNWRRKNGRVSIGTRGYKCDDWISLRQFLH